MRRLVGLWGTVREPRHLKAVYLAYYTVTLLTGLLTLLMPPRMIETSIGLALTVGFSGFLIAGGLFGALAVLPGWWWLERLGCVAALCGLGMFCTVVFASTSSALAALNGVAVLASGLFVIRLLSIRRYSFEPRR